MHAQTAHQSFPAAPPLADTSETRSALISPAVLGSVVRVLEAGFIAATGLLLASAYVEADARGLGFHATAALAAGFMAVLMFSALGLYAVPVLLNPVRSVVRVLGGWCLASIGVIAAAFFLKIGADISRVWLLAWFVIGAAGLIAGRFGLAAKARAWSKAGRLNRRAVIYGSGPACEALVKALEQDPTTDIRICGMFDDRGERAGDNTAGYPNRGRLDDLIAFARASRVDLVLMALPISAETRLMHILQKLWVLPVDIRLAASASRLRFSRTAYSYVGNVALLALADRPISDWGMISKAVFDRVVAACAIVALAPVMVLTALAIRLDSKGPVIFRQKRYGFNNELIEVFKFRSMYTDMTDVKAEKLVTKDDPRVTKVGRFIRKTSLDELPQLFNVLLGTLSLVGPRPHAVSAKAGGKLYDEAVDSYFARHKVKPGITGWAQINGWRGETDTEEKLVKRIEHDLDYIENWSLALDLYILVKTPVSLLKTENAY